MISKELTAAIEALIPPDRNPRHLSIYATSALYEYFLAPDGTVFEQDHDSVRSPEPVDNPSTVRVVYAVAARKFPSLAALAFAG